jgi:Homeodomain-like domain
MCVFHFSLLAAAAVTLNILSPEQDVWVRRYGVAVDLNRAADLYAQGWTVRQIAAELGVTATTVSEQLRRVGVTMRRGGPAAHPASTEQILDLRDLGLTWPEIAEQVGMTVSGAWSRYQRARPPRSPRLGRWQQVLADALDQNLAIGVRAAVADHLGRAPTRAELTAARRAAHSLAAMARARVLHVPGTDGDADVGDRGYLVLAKPNVIINDIRLRGLGSPEATLPVGRAPTTTHRPLGTSGAPSRMRPLVPG